MKQIRVKREQGYYGMARGLRILVDGDSMGNIKQGETLNLEVPENSQEIWGKMDWAETPRLSLRGYDLNKTIIFKAYFSLNLLKNLGVIKMPFNVFLR